MMKMVGDGSHVVKIKAPLCALLLGLLIPSWAVAEDPKSMPPRAPSPAVLNTIDDVFNALRRCWQWPPTYAVNPGLEITILMSFRRNGEIFGFRVTHATRRMTEEDRALLYGAAVDMVRRCSPLPFTDALGSAVAGRPFVFRVLDTRGEKSI